jgi:hypothetical protein
MIVRVRILIVFLHPPPGTTGPGSGVPGPGPGAADGAPGISELRAVGDIRRPGALRFPGPRPGVPGPGPGTPEPRELLDRIPELPDRKSTTGAALHCEALWT